MNTAYFVLMHRFLGIRSDAMFMVITERGYEVMRECMLQSGCGWFPPLADVRRSCPDGILRLPSANASPVIVCRPAAAQQPPPARALHTCEKQGVMAGVVFAVARENAPDILCSADGGGVGAAVGGNSSVSSTPRECCIELVAQQEQPLHLNAIQPQTSSSNSSAYADHHSGDAYSRIRANHKFISGSTDDADPKHARCNSGDDDDSGGGARHRHHHRDSTPLLKSCPLTASDVPTRVLSGGTARTNDAALVWNPPDDRGVGASLCREVQGAGRVGFTWASQVSARVPQLWVCVPATQREQFTCTSIRML